MSAALSRWLPVLVLVAGALLAWGLARGRSTPHAAAPEPLAPRVDVVALTPERHGVSVRTHGTVVPRTEIELLAETPGRVLGETSALEAGAFFEKGSLLVQLDPTDARLALERAEARVLRVRSEVRIAKARLTRQRSLASRDVASAAQVEEGEHALAVSRASLRGALAERDQARRDLLRTEMRAPFEGRVRERYVDSGQFVVRGTALARLYAVDYAEVRLPVAASELGFLETGGDASATVRLRASFAGEDLEWRARLVRTEGAIDPRTRMIHVIARVDDPYGRRAGATHPPLTVGLFVEAEIEGRTFADAFLVPRAALQGSGRLAVVDAEDRSRLRAVTVIRRDGDRVLIGGGILPGDRVRTTAVGAVEGRRVRPVLVDTVSPQAALARVGMPP
ncbi:MAG: efflux RND transporter periplasmic adaptor subunit [Myxococcota bacterium]